MTPRIIFEGKYKKARNIQIILRLSCLDRFIIMVSSLGGGFRFIDEYTADVAFLAYGESLEEMFINAARALMEIQTDLSKIEPKECVEVDVDGFDLENLMKKWLEELLFYRDTKLLFFSVFEIKVTEESDEIDVKYKLWGKICGEKFDPSKHESKVEVKAISYHDMKIEKKDNMYYAHILVDI